MTKQEIDNLLEEIKDMPNLPNNRLVSLMDKLSIEFDETKNSIIEMSYYLDSVETIYNKILTEYEKRNK